MQNYFTRISVSTLSVYPNIVPGSVFIVYHFRVIMYFELS